MSIENIPIKDLEQAKAYFLAMGCSHFHLSRESVERRDEYYAFKISRSTEMLWRQEEANRRLTEFSFEEPEKIGISYSALNDVTEYNYHYIQEMINLAQQFYDVLPPEQIKYVLSVIIGNNGTLTRGGLIEKAYKRGFTDLAEQLLFIAKKYLWKAENKQITILWLQGYLVDVIEALGLEEDNDYLALLRNKDNILSFQYYRQGAHNGNVFSMRMLARCFIDGKGCDANRKEAEHWLEKAATAGNDLAKEELAQFRETEIHNN